MSMEQTRIETALRIAALMMPPGCQTALVRRDVQGTDARPFRSGRVPARRLVLVVIDELKPWSLYFSFVEMFRVSHPHVNTSEFPHAGRVHKSRHAAAAYS